MKKSYVFVVFLTAFWVASTGFLQCQTTDPQYKISVGGWVDAQYRLGIDDEVNGAFQIRRARVDLKGAPTRMISFRLQADLASSPKLIDAYMRLDFGQMAALQIGQFKIPFSLENILSPLDVELADNAQVISALSGYKDVTGLASYANGRDIGIMLSGSLLTADLDGANTPIIKYDVGLFGGGGINVSPSRWGKDLAGRIMICPYLKGLTLSASIYLGNYQMPMGANQDSEPGVRRRVAAGAQYAGKSLTLRGEYLYGQTQTGLLDNITNIYEKYNFYTQGCYLTAGYWFYLNNSDNKKSSSRIRPLVRWDYYVKDESTGSASTYYWAGAEWWPERHLRFQLAYRLHKQEATGNYDHQLTVMSTVKF